MKEFNQQFSTLRLREEFEGQHDRVLFSTNDPQLDNLLNTKFYDQLENDGEYYSLDAQTFAQFEDLAFSTGFNMTDIVKKVDEEGSVTGSGEAYLAGLDVPEKVYKAGYVKKVKEENEVKDVEPKYAAGHAKVYMKDKWGWKDAPSVPNRPSKGGFIYKQLFEYLKEPLKEGIKTEITKRNKSQQFNEAAKLANKKLKEVNAILEYASKLKLELHETGNAPTNRLMEKIKSSVVEAYKKIKEL
jgi:hypothetical protein